MHYKNNVEFRKAVGTAWRMRVAHSWEFCFLDSNFIAIIVMLMYVPFLILTLPSL